MMDLNPVGKRLEWGQEMKATQTREIFIPNCSTSNLSNNNVLNLYRYSVMKKTGIHNNKR